MNTNIAPIALFVYNRPEHAFRTLSSLKENPLAKESKLFIFSDGAKNPNDKSQTEKIGQVREMIRKEQWCGEVTIIESPVNKGLANSLSGGITKIVNEFGKVIVIEDDLQFSPDFLNYLNTALYLYENNERVFSIAAFMFPIKSRLPETYFLHIPTWSGGWATWKRAWDYFNPDAAELLQKVKEKGRLKFDFWKSINWYRLLKRNYEGKVDSWAIRWYASVFVKDGLCLHPRQSLTRNIGFDASGTHSYQSSFWNTEIVDKIEVKEIPVQINKEATRALCYFNLKMKMNDLPHYIKSRIKGEYNLKSIKK
jgi:hypothetical protein